MGLLDTPFGPHLPPSMNEVGAGWPPWLAMVSGTWPSGPSAHHGGRTGPLMFLGELLMSSSEFCLNPLLQISRVDLAFSLAHLRKILRGPGSKSTMGWPQHGRFDTLTHFIGEDTDDPGGPQSATKITLLG